MEIKMNQDWQNFLISQGAKIHDGVVSQFGDVAKERLATRDGTVLCDLGQFGILRVSGEEAQAFLQNLLSNDIGEVGNNRAQYSSLNSAKGRMLASLLVWREDGDYLLQVPRVLCEAIRKKLAMYVLRSRVKVADASDEVILLGLSGTGARDILAKQFGDLPKQSHAIITTPQGSVIKISDARFLISTNATNAGQLWPAFSREAQAVGSVCWDWLNIRSGIPVILPATQEQFVAQMVNFELIGGVNFKKGCYPGQEIVARMQYLGKLKRRMYLAHLDCPTRPDNSDIPRAGDELFSAEMEGQACGMIVNAEPAPDGGYDVLASVQSSSQGTQQVHWKSLQGAALLFLPLPYALPDV
jgi:folate-binding protein YgfZ